MGAVEKCLSLFPGLGTRKETGGTAEGSRPLNGKYDILNMLENDGKNKARVAPPSLMKTAEFEKKLRWMIENPPTDAVRWLVTPKMAEIMLGWNTRNRPLAEATVRHYAGLMDAGRWHYTGEPVIFSRERLIDGQHRLAAVVAAGARVEMLIVFGAPDSSFAFIDVGKGRTASNIFAINGVKNHSLMAAATQWVVGYDSGRINAAAQSNAKLDHAALHDAYLKHERLQDSAWVGHVFASSRLAPPSIMVALHYICARKARGAADDFFRAVGEGLGFAGKKDPAYKLHQRLISNAQASEKLGRKSIAAITLKAWNASRLGRSVGALEFRADEIFPKAV